MEEESRGGEGGSHGTCEVLLCLGHSEGRGGPPFPPQPKRGSLPGCPRHDAAGTASSPPLAPARRRRSSSRRNTGHDEQQGDEIQLFYIAISMVSSSLTSDKVVG